MTTCPNCGASLAVKAPALQFVAHSGEVTYEGRSCILHPMQIDILEHLLDAYPKALSLDALSAELECDNDRRLVARIGHMKHRFKQARMAVDIECVAGCYALVVRSATGVAA